VKLAIAAVLALANLRAQIGPKPVPATSVEAGAAESPNPKDLTEIKRVYVEALAGDATADAIRQFLVASLQQLHLFRLTDNPDRADVVLRGAANDAEYTDQLDSQESVTARANGGDFVGRTGTSRGSGGYGGLAIGENEAVHMKTRKHEAYASVRLCNRDGDVLWATTQESHGAKFRGASADVAEKVVRQLQLDMNRLRLSTRPESSAAPNVVVQPCPGSKN
jgi:hypothetical protein